MNIGIGCGGRKNSLVESLDRRGYIGYNLCGLYFLFAGPINQSPACGQGQGSQNNLGDVTRNERD